MKSAKLHLRHVIAEIKLTFEELTTVLTQIEAYASQQSPPGSLAQQ